MSPRPKVPRRPPRHLTHTDRDVLTLRPVLWRIHRTSGEHVLPWSGFRTYGPLPSGRYDPHSPPPADQPGYGITYAADNLATAIAEVFQTSRRVNPAAPGDLHATSWTPLRPLRLLDVTGDWALRNGAAHALTAAPRPPCRASSRAIHDYWDDIDGLWAPSTLTGSPIAALYQQSATAMPAAPAFSRPLGAPVLWTLIADSAESIGYEIG